MMTFALIVLTLAVLALCVWTMNMACKGCIFSMLNLSGMFECFGRCLGAVVEAVAGD